MFHTLLKIPFKVQEEMDHDVDRIAGQIIIVVHV